VFMLLQGTRILGGWGSNIQFIVVKPIFIYALHFSLSRVILCYLAVIKLMLPISLC